MKLLWKTILFITITLVLINLASATNACCEKTTDGQWCAYVEESQCDSAFKSTYASCEQTSYCNPGCCYSSDTGQCFKNTAKAACSQVEGALWDQDKTCSIDQCDLGCCLMGDQAIFTTEVKCKKTASQFEELQFTFNNAIETEAKCTAEAKSQDQGCCVNSEGTGTFTTRGSCDTATEVKTITTETKTGTQAETTGEAKTVEEARKSKASGFYKDMLCSNDQLSIDCAKQSTTKCFGEDLYWVDSCGNKENIYSSDKTASYNKGYALKESESCIISSPEDQACGNCDYARGTICGLDKDKDMPVGTQTCVNLACESTYDDPIGASINADGKRKKNGESWCAYDSTPGLGLDAVGSRHYRLMCINGEEQVEPCKDFREELCIQGVLDETGKQEILDTYGSFFAQGDYIEASCRVNQWKTCTPCNTQGADEKTGQCTAPCQERRKTCCEDPIKDCYWAETKISASESQSGEEEITGYCAPQVPPGTKFWGDSKDTKEKDTETKTPKTSADTACSQMQPAECQVLYSRGGWERIGSDIGLAGKSAGWQIVANKKCTTKEYLLSTNDICRSMGDCGAHFNILGEGTLDGYHNTLSDEEIYLPRSTVKDLKLTISDLGEWHDLTGMPEKDPKGPDFFQNFFRSEGETAAFFGIGLASAIGSGLIGGILGTGGFFSAFATGLGGVPMALAGEATTKAALIGTYGAAGQTLAQQAAATLAESQANIAAAKATLAPVKASIASFTGTATEKAALEASVKTAEVNLAQAEAKIVQLTATQTSAQASAQATLGSLQAQLAAAQAQLAAAGTNEVQKQAAQKLIDAATEKIAEAQGTTTSQFGTSATLGTALNAAMWAYMIYKIVDMAMAQNEDMTYKVDCLPWQAPEGGEDCEKCNDPMKPCSEYKCKSLGQSCELINPGSGNETCVAIDRADSTSPIISAFLSALPADYQSEAQVTTDPSNPGYTITKKLKAFTPVTLGISTNEPAQCKLAVEPGKKFDEMANYFGTSIYLYNHTTRFVLPSELTNEDLVAKTGGEYSIFVRCKDSNGNANEKDYFIKFNIDTAPDLTPPEIQYTSILNNGYVAHGVNDTSFSAYVNEPSQCKWSKMDISYGMMENTMQCATSSFGQSSVYYGTYECSTTLRGIGLEPTNYFIKCKDQPEAPEEDRNTNAESFKFTLRGSKELYLLSLEPEGLQYTNNVVMKAITAVGAESGKASCAFSQQDAPYENMILFAKTDDVFHEQLFEGMATGDYTFHVKCRDTAGNEIHNTTAFSVAIDTDAPRIEELYVDLVVLYTRFNEQSTCEYSDRPDKAFGEGTMMTNANSTAHQATYFQPFTYYIKCKDMFGNQGSYEIHL